MAKYSKSDLKALMKEKLAAKSTKIESPLAAYNSTGQLTCRVCLTNQKESSWTAHLLSQQHKESIERLKRKPKKDQVVQMTKPIKRTIVDVISEPGSSVGESIEAEEMSVKQPHGKEGSILNSEQSELPVGFFDDPVRDARERNVVYKDPIEEEWTKFQKIITGETNKADVLVQDELEETQKEKTAEEIDKQLSSWQKIDQLQKRVECIRSNKFKFAKYQKRRSISGSEPKEDDENFDGLLDWRKKKSYK